MLINKEGKLFGKISIIDIIVLLALAILAFGIYTKINSPEDAKIVVPDQELEYTVEIKGVPSGTIYALEKQGALTNSDTKQYIGDITELSYTTATEIRTFSDGTIGEVKIPHRFTATIKVRVDGKIGDTGFFTAGNQSLYVGATLPFETKYVTATGTITGITEIEK